MTDHFAYLVGPTTKVGSVSADRLTLFAKVAAKRFVETRTPLTETVQKLASENDLTPLQVERVCEMANIATHQALWPHATEKEKVAFPLADSKAVIGGKGGSRDHSSGVDADYACPPRPLTSCTTPLSELMGVDPGAGHNGLSGPNNKQQLIIVLQKKAGERAGIRSKLITETMALESAVKLAFEAVKQSVIGEGYSFRNLFKAAQAAGLDKVARELFPKFEPTLIAATHGSLRLRLEKNAISKAPAEYFNENLGNVTVVNGAHPVLVSLDTVQKKNGLVGNLLRDLLRIDDETKVYGQRLRELNG